MRMLVVEDDALSGESLAMLLRARGHEVEWGVDGEAALTKLHAGRFDVLIVDHYMHHVDGLGLVRQMREQQAWRAVPVVILTAAADEPFALIQRELAGLGPARALRKPAGVEEVLAAIEGLSPRGGGAP